MPHYGSMFITMIIISSNLSSTVIVPVQANKGLFDTPWIQEANPAVLIVHIHSLPHPALCSDCWSA
jgi:hypothetical protein